MKVALVVVAALVVAMVAVVAVATLVAVEEVGQCSPRHVLNPVDCHLSGSEYDYDRRCFYIVHGYQ